MHEVAAARGIDLEHSYAYSDSITDLPMMEAVGHPVVVNPDRELAREAKARDWEVRWFSRKVPLRRRVTMPAPGPAMAMGGGLAATVAAAVVVFWWLRREMPDVPSVRPPGPSWRRGQRGRQGRRGAGSSSWRAAYAVAASALVTRR